MSGYTIEWAPFTLAEGATEDQLLDASQALQDEFLAAQDGFIRRELLRAGERDWCDLVYWRDNDAAQRAMEQAAKSPVCFRYFHLMAGAEAVEAGAGVQHFVVRRTYDK